MEARRVQVLDSDWFKTDHRAVLALSLKERLRYSAKPGVNVRGWKPNDTWQKEASEKLTDWKNLDAALLLEAAKAHRMAETKEMTGTELELKILLLQKRTSTPRASRVQQILPRNLSKTESAEAEKNMWPRSRRVQRRRKSPRKHFNWSSTAKQENPETVFTGVFQDLFSIPADQRDITQSERTHWIELWRNVSLDCAGGTLISTKNVERVLSKQKMGKVHQIRSQRMFWKLFPWNVWKSWRDRCL